MAGTHQSYPVHTRPCVNSHRLSNPDHMVSDLPQQQACGRRMARYDLVMAAGMGASGREPQRAAHLHNIVHKHAALVDPRRGAVAVAPLP